MRILLVEDNPGDIELVRRALRQVQHDGELDVARDGAEALAYLRSSRPRPDLVLLDLNLPKKSGREVLRELKDAPGLRRIPVVVLSGTSAQEDVNESYELHANSFIAKAADLPGLRRVTRLIEEYWGGAVTLPGT